MFNATQPLLGLSVVGLIWLYAASLVGTALSFARLCRGRSDGIDTETTVTWFICIVVNILAVIPLMLGADFEKAGAIFIAIIMWGFQIIAFVDLAENTPKTTFPISTNRTIIVGALAALTSILASILAFAH